MKEKYQHWEKLNAGRSALIYAIFGLIWILFSDQTVVILFQNPDHRHLAQNLKGFFYILVTTLLVYILIKSSSSTIRQQEAKARLLAENTQDVIWSLDAHWHIQYINPVIENFVGIPAADLLGKHVSSICDEKTLAFFKNQIPVPIHPGPENKGFFAEAELLHIDGTTIPVEINARHMFNKQNEVIGIQAVSRDIRERNALQTQLRQAQKLESIGTMASGIAHEVNNPISIISATAELLTQSDSIGDDTKDLLMQVMHQSENIHQIVNNLLGFVRVEKMPKPETIQAGIPLLKCLELAKASLQHDHIHVEVHTPEDVPDLTCLPHQIQQALLNLVQNAQDSLNERYPEADPGKQLHLSLSSPDAEHILFTVKDLGTGMNAEQIEKLFDPFYTTKPEGKGTGLGMWILHQIVKNHQGSIFVDSKPLEYTSIGLLLPLNFQTVSESYTPTVQFNSSLFASSIPETMQGIPAV